MTDEQRVKLNSIFNTNYHEEDDDPIVYWTDALEELLEDWTKENCESRPCNPYEKERYGWTRIFTTKGQNTYEEKQDEIYKVWEEVFGDEEPYYRIDGNVQEE